MVAYRHDEIGTVMVQKLCEELNEMSDDVRLVRFFTRVMSRINKHLSTFARDYEQIPELKIFPCKSEFTIDR